jgi:hypothetical protein
MDPENPREITGDNVHYHMYERDEHEEIAPTVGLKPVITDPKVANPIRVLHGKVEKIKATLPHSKFGVSMIASMYNTGTEPYIADITAKSRLTDLIRKFLAMGELLMKGSGGMLTRLSIFHQDDGRYAAAALGLQFAYIVACGIELAIKNQNVRELFNCLSLGNQEENTKGWELKPAKSLLRKLSKYILILKDNLNRDELDPHERAMLYRLDDILPAIIGRSRVWTVAKGIIQFLTFSISVVSMISTISSGQGSPFSYAIAIMSGGLAPISDTFIQLMEDSPPLANYIYACEAIFILETITEQHKEPEPT